jgi:hypothetical protein
MLSCEQATRLMSDAGERRLGIGQRVRLQLHWRICSGCRNFARQLEGLRSAMQRYAARPDDAAVAPDDSRAS